MHDMAFPDKWISWVKGCLVSGKGSILVDGSPTKEFKFKRGLRQGDPISPFLFIIALEIINMFMKRMCEMGLFKGIKLPNEGPFLSHLCYADDVIFIGEWSDLNVLSPNCLLRWLNLVTGLKVNPSKNKLFGVGVNDAEVTRLTRVLNCENGSFPFNYLDIPIGVNMKKARFWQPIVDKFNRKLSRWKANHLSFAGRMTLAKSVLGSLPSYFLSLFSAPKVIINKLEKIRRDFLWGKTSTGHKIRWVKWGLLVFPRKDGGLGLGGIEEFNQAMLCKWWWRLKSEPNHLWAKVITAIHKSKIESSLIPLKRSTPGVWKDIGNVEAKLLKSCIRIQDNLVANVGNGSSIRFWKDVWLFSQPIKDIFPDIFSLAKYKNARVAEYASLGENTVQWRWDWLRDPISLDEWQQIGGLMSRLGNVKLTNVRDEWRWKIGSGDGFSAKQVRLDIQKAQIDVTGEFRDFF
ncbi:putative RNA-directed DNA polymerase [Helianthus annuus]|nr:putative RNA-directed DNA polymerase [Helianthus annuus]KAJ0825617.1 putative RNA-directed DNA polymerase [Helianthus annuus]